MRGKIIEHRVMWFAFEQIVHISLYRKLVPVQYREYETGLFQLHFAIETRSDPI